MTAGAIPPPIARLGERLRYVQSYLIASVRSAFAALTGLPDAPSNQIEDLQDLDAIDPSLQALRELVTRQTQIEQQPGHCPPPLQARLPRQNQACRPVAASTTTQSTRAMLEA